MRASADFLRLLRPQLFCGLPQCLPERTLNAKPADSGSRRARDANVEDAGSERNSNAKIIDEMENIYIYIVCFHERCSSTIEFFFFFSHFYFRDSEQAVVSDVAPPPPPQRYVPSVLSRRGFDIPNACRL